MNSNSIAFKPHAVSQDIIIQELSDETLIYKSRTHKMLSLNKTASAVWQNCDGKNTPAKIAELVSNKFKSDVSEEVVLFALETLKQNDLLIIHSEADQSIFISGVSRREMIRRAGVTAVVALPLITSLIAPSAAQSASSNLLPIGGICQNNDAICQSGCCFDGFCNPPDACFI